MTAYSNKFMALLWDATFGSGWEEHPWWISIHNTPGSSGPNKTIKVEDPDADPRADELLAEGPPTVTFTVTPTKLAAAYEKALTEGMVDACTGAKIGHPDGFDSCIGDLLIQLVAFGEEVYA